MTRLPYRPNVCLLIRSRDGRLFLGERAGCPGVWQFPQGGIEPEFSEEENALKEAGEELGVARDRLRAVRRLKAEHRYEFDVVPAYAAGRWRGQAQSFWLLEYLGKDDEIDLARFAAELMAWKWCTPAQVRSLAEPKRLPGYLAALAEFEEIGRNLRN